MLDALRGRMVVRRLALPAKVRVVAVGGATFGGSGKTPLAIACAVELARRGARVALVGHAYRARPGRPRIVDVGDPLGLVGDEALVAARALQAHGVRVVVAPRRSDAIAHASRDADVLVLDGVGQTAPVRASLALLAVDPVQPWSGGLRAPVRVLLAACDRVVPVTLDSRGAWLDRSLIPWEALAARRVGLFCALGRPERLLRTLAARGVVPRAVVRTRDHGPFPPHALSRAARAPVDLWLATPKCALHVRAGPLPVPVATLDHSVVLPAAVDDCLRDLAVP
jgi:tetraacyldisaccharide 4'-kinase